MFPCGRKRARETAKDCLRREIKEELPKLKLGRVHLWREVKSKNRRSGRKMSDAIFIAPQQLYIELRLYRARIRCKNAFAILDLDGRSLDRGSAERMSNPNLHEHY